MAILRILSCYIHRQGRFKMPRNLGHVMISLQLANC